MTFERASLRRTYGDISQDTLDYRYKMHHLRLFESSLMRNCFSNQPAWPILLYSVAFLHTVVQVKTAEIYFGIIFNFKLIETMLFGQVQNGKLASRSVDTVSTFVQLSQLCCLSGFEASHFSPERDREEISNSREEPKINFF